MDKKKNKILKIVLIALGSALAIVIAFVGGFIIFATATTLKVKDNEEMIIEGNVTSNINIEEDLDILTWNIGYGASQGQIAEDAEGMQTMRTLANNMAALLKATGGKPMPGSDERHQFTNFIR